MVYIETAVKTMIFHVVDSTGNRIFKKFFIQKVSNFSTFRTSKEVWKT